MTPPWRRVNPERISVTVGLTETRLGWRQPGSRRVIILFYSPIEGIETIRPAQQSFSALWIYCHLERRLLRARRDATCHNPPSTYQQNSWTRVDPDWIGSLLVPPLRVDEESIGWILLGLGGGDCDRGRLIWFLEQSLTRDQLLIHNWITECLESSVNRGLFLRMVSREHCFLIFLNINYST